MTNSGPVLKSDADSLPPSKNGKKYLPKKSPSPTEQKKKVVHNW